MAREHIIFPPVAVRAESAASSVGSRAGSGFLISAKRVGNCASRDVMTDLEDQQDAKN